MTLDNSGNILTTGMFENTCDFDPGPGIATLVSDGSTQIYVCKLDGSGNFVWAREMGGNSTRSFSDIGSGIAVDSADNVYTTGHFEETADFDPGVGTYTLIGNGREDIFVSKLDSAGAFVWAYGTGGAGFDEGRSIAVDGPDGVYLTGSFRGPIDLDFGWTEHLLFSTTNDEDIFLAKPGFRTNLPAAGVRALVCTALAMCVVFAMRRRIFFRA